MMMDDGGSGGKGQEDCTDATTPIRAHAPCDCVEDARGTKCDGRVEIREQV